MMTNSDHYFNLLKRFTPNGSQTLSKMPNKFVEGVYPKVLSHGYGGRVWDVDGREYVDMIAGLGAISVGYCNPYIDDKVKTQLDKGVLFSLPTVLEYEVSKRLTELVPFTEQWKFLKTGSEATTAAVKAARAITGRDKVMTCGYHAWMDWYAIQNNRKAGIPSFNQDLVTKVTYNKWEDFKQLESEEYACLIIEPYVFDTPVPEFFWYIQDLCEMSGTLLIFDEVVTGGRTKFFTAAANFQIEPDLITMSKGIANGFPLSAVGGKKEIMSVFERDDFFVSGTFGWECVSLAACLETLNILEKSIDKMYYMGEQIKDYFMSLFGGLHGCVCKGYPTRLTFDFPTPEHKALFMQEMCLNGVLTGYSNMVMADYTKDDVDKILNALRVTNSVFVDNWTNPKGALRGSMPVEALRLR
jgi:glutamate-1-semialdehyde 2,1-aminomutase